MVSTEPSLVGRSSLGGGDSGAQASVTAPAGRGLSDVARANVEPRLTIVHEPVEETVRTAVRMRIEGASALSRPRGAESHHAPHPPRHPGEPWTVSTGAPAERRADRNDQLGPDPRTGIIVHCWSAGWVGQEGRQPVERAVPVGGERGQVGLRHLDWLRPVPVGHPSPAAGVAGHQARVGEQGRVLGDALPGDRQPTGQIGRGARSVLGQRGEDRSTGWDRPAPRRRRPTPPQDQAASRCATSSSSSERQPSMLPW